jgi:hypothetical protein
MSTVVVTVVAQAQQFPAGTSTAGIKVSLAGFPEQTLTAAPYVAEFADVGPGEFAITAQAVDAEGNALGEAVTGSVTIAAPVVEEAPAPVETPAEEVAPVEAAPVVEETPAPAPEVTIDVPASLSVEVK